MQITTQVVHESVAGAIASDDDGGKYVIIFDRLEANRTQARVYSLPVNDPVFACEMDQPYDDIDSGVASTLRMMREV